MGKDLYDYLDQHIDLGNREVFRRKMESEESRRNLWNQAREMGFYHSSFEAFSAAAGHPVRKQTPEKTAGTHAPASAPQQTPDQTSEGEALFVQTINPYAPSDQAIRESWVRSRHKKTPRRLAGVVGPHASASAPADATAVAPNRRPRLEGEEFVGGQFKPSYRLADGTLTTSIAEADRSERETRENRRLHAFEQRMIKAGRNPEDPYDRAIQEALESGDSRAAGSALFADADRKADAYNSRMAEISARLDAVNAASQSEINKAIQHAVAVESSRLAAEAQERTRIAREHGAGALQGQGLRKEPYDPEKMIGDAWAGLSSAARTKLVKEYQAIFKQNPDLIPDGKTPFDAAISAIRQTLFSNLVAREAERRAPKSNAEFVARKILNDNILSLPYQLAGQSKSQHRAEFSAMNAYESEHPYWGITGSVIGMAVDPITWISGGVGKGASKIATGAVMRPIAATTRGNATRIVERALLSGALKGWRPAVVRGAGAVAGGSANFGTFEFLKDIQQQVFLGGTVDEYGNVIDGFDIGSSFDRARHGLAMGGATGVLGQAAGSLSKSAGRIVNTVARGAAKVGTWSAGVAAEAGLFTLPELIEGKDDLAGAYRRNLAMVLGFKAQGALHQGASTVRKIREAHQRTGISLPDAVRLVRNENNIGSEFLTEHDRETLRRAGCGDLTDILFPEHGKTSRGQGRPSDGSKWWEKAREVSVAHAQQGEGSTSKLKDVTDGYELLQRALENKSVPQELKAKLIHIVTGGYVGTSPIHNVRTARRGGEIIVEALDRNGEVISSRNFKSERAAKAAKASLEQDVENGEHFTLVTEGANARLVRQTELALHEYARQNGISYDEAVRLYNDAARTVKDHDLDATAPEQTPTDPVEQAKALLRTICGMADAYHDNTRHMSPEAVAASMSAKYGVDMIKIINKPRASRNAEEKRLFSEYLDTLRRVARSKTEPREPADGASLGDYSSAVPSDRSRGAMWLSRLGLDPDRLGNFPERIGERLRNFCSTLTGSESARELKKTRKIYDKARRRLADAIAVHADDLESSLGELLDKLDTLPASRREQILDFLRTKAEFEVVRDRYLTDRQQRESAMIRRIRERAYHANPGNIVTVRLKDGRTLYKIAHAADYFIAIDENGRPEMIPHDRIESETHSSVEDAIEAARARLDAEDADPLTPEQTPDNPEPPSPTPETQAPEVPTSESTPTPEVLSSDTSAARVTPEQTTNDPETPTPEPPVETPTFREGTVEIALEDGKTIKGHIYDREPDGTYRIATADGRVLTLTESEAKTLIKSYKPKQTPEQTPDNPEQTPEPTPTPETLSSDASAARVTPEAPEVAQAPKETQADPQAHPDVKPVGKGKFGDIYAAFRGKAKAAWQYLSALKSGQARGVFYRPEIGEIDLVWGDAPTPYSGKGLAHIDRKHVKTLGDFTSMDEAIEVIDDVVRNGEIKEEKANSIAIEKDRYRVIVARDEAGNWVLTAFDNTTSAKEKKKRKDAATRGTAGQPNAEARAVASDLSSGKVNTSLSDKQPQSQKSSDFLGIPLDEKGKPDYTGVPVEKTVAVMDSEDLGLRDAENTLKGAVKRRDAARRKLDGILVDMTDPARGKAARARAKAELDRCEKEVAYWQAVHDVYAARQADEKRKADEAEAARKAEEREWKETKSRMDSRLRKVAEEVRDVPEAVEILNNSNPQTIEEVAALVLSGHKVLLGDGPNAERGARRFAGMGTTESKKLIGLFAKADKGGKSLEKLSETVMMETCAEYGVPYDQAEALDALMTVLNTVETRGDIHSFIVNARIERARNVADGIRAQWAEMEAEAIWEAYRMTPEEFRAYEEHRMEIARQALENFDEYEYNSYIADQLAERAEQEAAEAAKQNEHGLETDSGPEPARESPADGRSSEILSRQEPDLAPRSRTDEDRSQLPQGNGDQSRDPQRPLGEAERVAGAGNGIGNTGDAGRNGERADNLEQAEEVGCELSEEVNEFGRPFVKSSDGTTTFGHIDPESGLAALPIKLSLGENYKDANGDDHGYGYLHIDAGHRKEILQNGFASVEDFVEAVAKNYTEIKEGAKIGENQTYLLEVSDEHNNTLFIQLSRDGKYWNVNSAGIFKKKYSRRKPKVYSKPAVGSGKDTDTTEVNSGQSKGATAPAGNSSETSDRKDNTLLSRKQGNGAESSKNGELMDKAIGLRDSMNEALYWINDRYGTDYSGIDSLIRWAVTKGGIKALDRIADNYLSPSDAAKFKRELREYNSINKKISESSRGRLSIPTSPDSPLNTSVDGRPESKVSGPPQENIPASEERDENGYPFVTADDGSTLFGFIDKESGLTPAPIKLSEGFQNVATGKGYGLLHIEARRGSQIRAAGFKSVKEFVSFVARNYDPANIRIGKRRKDGSVTFLIQVTDEHNNTLYIELSKDGSYWNVNSGGIFRKGYSDKKETVVKTEPQQPNNAVSSDSSLSADEQSGISSAEPNGKSSVSDGKVNTSPSDKQAHGPESSRGRLSIPTSPDSPLNTQRQIAVTRNNSMSPASIERTAASLGLKVRYYQGGSYENGYYHDGVLHINTSRVDNGSNGNMFVLGHEMTHHLKTRLENPVLWKNLVEAARRMLIDSYGRAGYEARLQRTEMAYAEMEAARRGISIEEARHHVDRRYVEEELTADAVGDMLANPRMARRLFERLENPSAAAAVWRTIRDFFRRTTAALGLGSPYQTRHMQATVDALSEVYTEALGHLRSQKTPDREALFVKAPSFSAGDRNTATKKSLDTTRAADRDARYLKALRDGDMATARRLVEQAAAEAGYSPDSDYQGTSAFNGPAPSNAYARSKDERRADWETDDYEGDHTLGDWLDFMRTPDDQLDFLLNNPNGMRSASATARESISALRRAISEGNRRIKVYRSVPADIKENTLRDGDWVTPSRTYAKENADVHGWGENCRIIEQEVDFDDLWWDSNDINEWGYDSSSDMAYANTPNNRKLLETVTRDDAGEIIPLSRRFDPANSDPRYSFATGPDDFDRTRDLAARHKGLVMPGLADKDVKVVDVPLHDFKGPRPIAQAKSWANEHLVGMHWLTDNNGSRIEYLISNKTIGKYLSRSAIDKSANLGVHLATLRKLPEIISESLEVEIHPDYNKNTEGSRTTAAINPDVLVHRFYGLAEIDEQIYRVKTTIKESKKPAQPAAPHSFEVTEIELLSEDNSSIKVEPTDHPNNIGIPHRTAKLLKGVTKSYNPSVEVLKEDTNYVKSDSEATLGDLQSEAGSTKFSIRTDSEPRRTDKARIYDAAKRMLETAGIEVTEVSDAEARAAADLAGAAYHIKTNRNGGALNYVVSRDKDMKIAGHTRFMRDHRGRIYGWVKDGKVFLNRDAMNPETPLHEYTHLWDEMVRKENPGLWERGKTLMKKLPLWEEVANDPAYAAIGGDENEIAGEVHSRLTGRDGARILSSLISDAKKRGVMETARAVTLVDHLKRWLGDMFRGLKKTLSKWSKQDLEDLTAEEFAHMTLRDLAEGLNPKSGEKTLVAIHNISEENLKKALDLGGFPMPSIAITKAGIGHTGFGGISLVFGKESINPADRYNKVYSGDAWTPTFPETGYKLNSSNTREIYDRANKAGHLPLFRAVDFHPDNYERRIDSRKDDSLVDAFKDDYGAKQLFLSEKGNAVKEYEKRDVEKYSADDINLYEKVLDVIGEDRLRGDDSDSLHSDLKRLIGEHSGKDMGTMMSFVAKALVSNTRRKALDYADNGNLKTETDLEATRAKIDERIDPREFQAWLEEMFSGVVEKTGIRNERDMFTPSGESRAWEALYDAVTLDNVVKAMRRQADKGGTGFFGGSIFGASHRELKNMNDIRREAAERIRSVYDEEIETEKKRLEERLNKITLPSVEGSFSASMDFVDNVRAAVVKSHTPEGIYRYLSDIYPDMTMDVAKDISDIVGEIQKMSTRYLEAKPQRAVKFGEVRLAVVPAGTPDEIVKTLEDYGIAVRTYERGNEHERNAIISRETSERDLRFHAAMSREETDFDAIRERASDPTNPTTDFVEQRERSSRNSDPRYSFATGPDDFDRTRDLAARHKGLVMPGLADKDVKVVDVPRHNLNGPGLLRDQIDTWADKNPQFFKTHSLIDSNGAEIPYKISKKALLKYKNDTAVSKSDSRDAHFSVLQSLPKVLDNSIEVEIHPDFTKAKGINGELSRSSENNINPTSLMHRFFGAVEYEGKLYRVKTTIKEFRDKNTQAKPHTFEVIKIELLESPSHNAKSTVKPLMTLEQSENGNAMLTSMPVAKLLKGVTKSYDPSVEVLKENTNYVKSDSIADRKSSIMTGLDVDEMLSRGAVDLANDHRDDMELRRNAYKAIGGNLSKLRKAMAIQRDFDRASVKRVADLAEAMIDAGLLRGTTDYDVRRVLKSLRDANGKEDISKETDRLFDIMVRSFQRQSEADFNKLLKQKGSRLDTLGIDVRTNLEVTGQAMMSKLREAIHLPEIAYDLNGDLMPDTIQMHLDKAIEELREARKTGMGLEEATGRVLALQYAQRYARSVDECRHNIAELKNDLAQLKETRKQGNGMSAKQYRDAVRAIRDRIREERLRSAKEIAGLSQDIATMMTQSATWADVLRLAEIERIDAIHHDANADLKGIEPRNTRDPRYDSWAKRWNRRIKSSLPAKWLSQSLATFEQCLKLFGRNSMDGSGYLYRRFMPQVTEAYENCWKARVEDTRMLDRIVADAFGDEKMTWSRFGDRLGLARRNRLKFLNGKNGGEGTETLDVTFWDGAGMHAYKIGVGEAMYIYMADKSSDGHMKLCAMGIDAETVDKLTAILPPEVIAVADALQNTFFVETRKRYNEVHKRIFGTEMEANENYVPMVINKNALDGKGDFTTDSPDNGLSSTTTGSVIRRKVNARPLDILNANIFNVVNKHIEDMEHWAAFSQLSKDLNSLINYKTFANKVAHITSSLGTGDELMRTFRECCQLATGNFRQADSALDRLTLKVGKNVSVAKVSLRLYTAFKQLSSAPAFWTDASASDIIYCGYNLRGSWEWAMKNLPMLNERWKGRSAGNEKIDHGPDAKSWLSRQMEAIAKAGMSPNAFVDALTCATGARAVYRTRLKRYRAMGYTEKDAARKALDDAEMSFNLSQQSSVGAYLSPMQMKRTVLSTALTLFRNSPMSYQRQSATALRNLSRHYRAGARDEMKRYRVKQLLREWGYDVEQQTGQYDGRTYEQSERLATSIADREWRLQPLKDLARLGIFGYVMPATWNLFTEAPGIVAALMAGDFDDAKDKFKDALVHALTGGWFEGLVAGNWFSDTIHSMISGDGAAADFVRHPLSQDLDRIKDKLDYDAVEALSDITGLLCQSYAGFNPAVLTDAVSAIIDATQGDMTTSKEIALCMARLAQVPQSQLNDIYFRELGCTGAEATKMTPAEISERYVRYKSLRTTLCLHDVASLAFPRMTEKREQRFARQSDKALKEQRLRLWSDDLNEKFDLYSERAEEYRKADKEIRDNKNLLQTARLRRDLYRQPQWWQTTTFKAGETWLNHLWETYMTAKTPEEAAQAVDRLRTAKPEIVEAVKQSTTQSRAARWTTKWKTDQKRRENRRKRTLPKTDVQRTDDLRNRIADLAAQPFD